MKSPTQRLGPGHGHQYNRETVERALVLHLGPEGSAATWTRDGKGGYHVATRRFNIHLRTLREAAVYVVGMADKAARLAAEAKGEVA